DYDAATALSGEALALGRSLGDPTNEALALMRIAHAAWRDARTDDARRPAEEALGAAARADNAQIVIEARLTPCQILAAKGDAEGAETIVGTILETTTEDEIATRRRAMHFLADCAVLREDYDLGVRRYAAAAEADWATGNRMQTCRDLHGVAIAAAG